MNLYLVCFDITDDKNRDRVGRELLAYGNRVQKSVFEILVRESDELNEIREKLLPLLEDGDDLRFYFLCADCRQKSMTVCGERLAHFPAAVII